MDTNKMVPTDLLKLIAFFEQCQVANKVAGVLEKIAKNAAPAGDADPYVKPKTSEE
jgi:hypothetical protein